MIKKRHDRRHQPTEPLTRDRFHAVARKVFGARKADIDALDRRRRAEASRGKPNAEP